MELLLTPVQLTSKETISLLSVSSGGPVGAVCFILEDVVRDLGIKVKGETAIPEGRYQIGTRFSPRESPRYKHDMLWVKDVPGFQYILIHPGNTRHDTEGCLLPGDKIGVLGGEFAVLNSKDTYLKKVYPLLITKAKAGELFITIKRSKAA